MRRLTLGLALALSGAALAAAPEAARLPVPAPGSYALPSLGAAADGEVVEAGGAATTLHALYANRIVLLAFVYSACSESEGCPLATASLHRVGRLLADDAAARESLRVLSLSFDPERDTPARMQAMANGVGRAGLDWRFLTTASQRELAPILAAYGQSLVRERGADGRETGAIAHVLRVFLIDPAGRIRNIYSSGYLDPELVAADVRTLYEEAGLVGP